MKSVPVLQKAPLSCHDWLRGQTGLCLIALRNAIGRPSKGHRKPRMFCRCHDAGRLKEQSPYRCRVRGGVEGLRDPGRGALGQRHPLIDSRQHSASWSITNVHLEEMRVVGGAWLAESWVQSPS